MLPFEEHVTFGFYYGVELPDPGELFGGTSRNKGTMRSIKITEEGQVEQPELRDLVAAETRQIVPPPKEVLNLLPGSPGIWKIGKIQRRFNPPAAWSPM